MSELSAYHLGYRETTCPACGHHIAVPFFDGGEKPLATIAWPGTHEEALSMPRYPLDFVSCVDCSHVFNAAFDYNQVPYSSKPNLMFNHGSKWSVFIDEILNQLAAELPQSPTVVEIGHGNGQFLRSLATKMGHGKYYGFDPNTSAVPDDSVHFIKDLFVPNRHIDNLRPNLIVSRHVLEHLMNPLAFLQAIAFSTAQLGLTTMAYFEVPCIDRAIATQRTVDFYYEHSSQFTRKSFTRMLWRSGASVEKIDVGYGGEVIYGILQFGNGREQIDNAEQSWTFFQSAECGYQRILDQLDQLYQTGKQVAIWGGTGKSAAFINRYRLDAQRFPIVVDSDPEKCGTFVPGTGQIIRFRDWLIQHPADIILIPPQWRADDIVLEMSRVGIQAETILIEHEGRLVEYQREFTP